MKMLLLVVRLPIHELVKRGIIILALFTLFTIATRESAEAFSWSGDTIIGDDSGYTPEGSAVFSISGNILNLTLTNTGPVLPNNATALTGLTWDILNTDISLTATTATASNVFLPTGRDTETDVTGNTIAAYWAFKNNISKGSLGGFGVSTVGDLLGGPSGGFGTTEIINNSVLLDDPTDTAFASIVNGADFSIVSSENFGDSDINTGFNPGVDGWGFPDGLMSSEPFVRNFATFEFVWSTAPSGSDLLPSQITNIQPIFGTEGQITVPEPSTMLLLGSGLLGLCLYGRRKIKKK